MPSDSFPIPPQSLIVSCQAPINSPLHHPFIIAAMAETAIIQGAGGVRIDTPAHIQAVRERISAPIIGLWKQSLPNYEIYITPRFEAAQALAAAGADMIAIDATLRPRPPGESVSEMIDKIHQHLNKPVMADVDSLEAALQAVEMGADCVATTLYGYTSQTAKQSPPGFELLKEMVKQINIPVICEGGIATPEMANRAIKLGADAVVVGTAITGIDKLVQAYQTAIQGSVISD
ncbi:MAG: N-acetylmannosamine-6-phosphate 2-epimerase [Microcoleaceae cyanobacterium]